jgi:hypothetical protein
MEEIVNKVANSGLLQIDLETLYPSGERVVFDLKDLLYEGLLLREKDFRAFLKTHEWSNYVGKHIAITCSTNAIVPTWAYMLLSIHLTPYAQTIVFGNLHTLEEALFSKALQQLDLSTYQDAKVVVKGCSKQEVPLSAYIELSKILRPVVSSLMFGEPCSTVPLYKRKGA